MTVATAIGGGAVELLQDKLADAGASVELEDVRGEVGNF